MRSTSLIITVFGDVIACHGGVIWLGSLVKAMSLVGVNERLVRTSVFRLVKEDWLHSEKVGRRSYYRFTDYGQKEYLRVAKWIYGEPKKTWQGRWQLLLVRDINDSVKEKVRRSLHWQGFRFIAPGLLAKPVDDDLAAIKTLEEFEVRGQVIPMDASAIEGTPDNLLVNLVSQHWRLEDVADRYTGFLKRFKVISSLLEEGESFSMSEAFVIRVLLVHDFRRAILKDIRIPDELLPSRWPGRFAEELAADIYLEVASESCAYIRSELENEKGLMGPVSPDFQSRFKVVG